MSASDVVRKIAQGWIVLGALGLIFVFVFAIAHYVFGVTVHEAHSQHVASSKQMSRTLIMLFAGSAAFTAVGWALFRIFGGKK